MPDEDRQLSDLEALAVLLSIIWGLCILLSPLVLAFLLIYFLVKGC